MKLLEKIFSVKNEKDHKVLTIFGFKSKFRLCQRQLVKYVDVCRTIDNNAIFHNVGELFGFSKTDKKEILKKNLTQIEIEIFSYCNRQCWFCPNSFIDRHSENHFMDENIYLDILKQLKEIDYSNVITYSRYNEPLSNREVFIKRLKQAREYCPNALLRTNSNGDFLTSIEYLDELADAGLQEIDAQCYLNIDEEYSIDIFQERVKKFAQRLNLNYRIEKEQIYYRAFFNYDKLSLSYTMYDFKNIANNRGESLSTVKEYARKEACLVPFQHIYIDYTGDVMLCCNLRHDIESHKNFIIGNVNNQSLAEIFMGEKIINYRKLLCCDGVSIAPCRTCKFKVGTERMNLGVK